MSSLNNVVMVGHLTRDPVLKNIPSGASVCEFGLALNRVWKNKEGQPQEEVTYVDVSAWGKLADICAAHLNKGRMVGVVGRLKQDRWETQDGQKRSKLVVIAENVIFIGPKKDNAQEPPVTPDTTPAAEENIAF